MRKDLKEKACAEAKRAQLDYERNVDAARQAFERAQKAPTTGRAIHKHDGAA
jgi:hypothetical protein